MPIKILPLLFLLSPFTATAQPHPCDTLYTFAQTMPRYGQGDIDFLEYVHKEIAPILSTCYERDGILIHNVFLTLTIDYHGRVIAVDFPRTEATEACKEALRQKLLAMEGWEPGRMAGRAVCCSIMVPVRIHWEK